MEGDIKGCFDHISHKWLIDNIPMDKIMLKKWLKCGFVFNKQLFPTEEGTPQGGIISPTLANMTLDGLQGLLAKRFKAINTRKCITTQKSIWSDMRMISLLPVKTEKHWKTKSSR